jgi:hypothetical protein
VENDRRGVQRRGLDLRICKGSVMACKSRMWRLNPAAILVYIGLFDRSDMSITGLLWRQACHVLRISGFGLWRCSGVPCPLLEKWGLRHAGVISFDRPL